MDVWNEVARGRQQLADQVDALDAEAMDAPSWCEGWRCRDVLGHLVYLAEATQRGVWWDVVRLGPHPDKMLTRRALELGERPVPELTERLRAAAGGRFHPPGSPSAVALGELLVHANDLLAPLDAELDVEPEAPATVIPVYARIAKLVFGGGAEGVTLVADDTDLRVGQGPEVGGRAYDLLVLMANRHQVLDRLTGPGVEVLAARG